MDDDFMELADEADAIADAVEQAEDMERFFRKGGGGAAILADLRDQMVECHMALPFAEPEAVKDLQVTILAYRLLVSMVRQKMEWLEEMRHDVAASDQRFMSKLVRRDETQED